MPTNYTDEEKKCFELLKTLNECHVEHPYRRYLGFCISLGKEYQKCYNKAFQMKQSENAKKSEIKKAQIRNRIYNNGD